MFLLKQFRYLFALLIASFLMHCQSPSHDPGLEPASLALSWQVISHLESADSFSSELTITNTGSAPLESSGWTLYFNFIRMIDVSTAPTSVKITHINGDFFKLEPTTSFSTLAKGENITIPFETSFWAIKRSDAPAGFYIVYTDADGNDGVPQVVIDYSIGTFETPAQTMRNANDELPVPTPASRFAENATLEKLDLSTLPPVVPSPRLINSYDTSSPISLGPDLTIQHSASLQSEASYLANALAEVFTEKPVLTTQPAEGANVIRLTVPAGKPTGLVLNPIAQAGYNLTISGSDGVVINAKHAAGVFHGIQTLRGLISSDDYRTPKTSIALPQISLYDEPRFEYRGMHIDVARNFHSKESILKMLELMAFYKLNKFHFHLTDDEGWRLEIEDLPELTSVGAHRGHTLTERDHLYPSLGSGPDPARSNGSGYYSRQDFIEILQFATERHIEVIPEIDLPGHARAAIRAMEARYEKLTAAGEDEAEAHRLTHPGDASKYRSVQMWNDNVIDVCLPSTYNFVETVIDDLVSMYDEAGTQLKTLHTGNDEVPHGVWIDSPACAPLDTESFNDYFLQKLYEILQSRGLNLAGWEEIALHEQTHNGVTTKEPNPAFIDSNFRPYVWNAVWGWGSEGTAYKLANAGYKVVLSNATNLYFDFAYDKDPDEPGFYWAGFSNTRKAFAFNPHNLYQNASTSLFGQPIDSQTAYASFPRLTRMGQQNILGIQGQLWSESAKGPALLEYQVFPKLLGLAERAWASPPTWFSSNDAVQRDSAEEQGWNIFANQLGQREFKRLDYFSGGVGYRIPPPGTQVILDEVHANVAFPGLDIRYTTENRDPTLQDPLYTTPIPFEGQVHFRAFSSSGRSSRTVTIGAKPLPE